MYDHRQQNSPFAGIIWKPGLIHAVSVMLILVAIHYHGQNIDYWRSLRSIIWRGRILMHS